MTRFPKQQRLKTWLTILHLIKDFYYNDKRPSPTWTAYQVEPTTKVVYEIKAKEVMRKQNIYFVLGEMHIIMQPPPPACKQNFQIRRFGKESSSDTLSR